MTAPKSIRMSIQLIDLDMARRLLELEVTPAKGVKGANRKTSPLVVNRYAFEMLAGNWTFSHQGFALVGYLGQEGAEFKDGLHRAKALVQACTVGATMGDVTLPPNPDTKFEVFLTEGLSEESWLVMDSGKPRRAHEFLTSDGEVNSFVLSSTIALIWLYQNETPGSLFVRDKWTKVHLSPMARKQFLDSNPTIRDAVYEGSRLNKVMTVASASAGYFLALNAGVDEKKVNEFMDLMQSGANMGLNHPALRLRELLKNARTKKRSLPREDQLALFIKALKAFVAGNEVGGLSFRTNSKGRSGVEPFPRFKVQ